MNQPNSNPRHFEEELHSLQERLQLMGGMAEERADAAMRALVERDPALILDVTHGDEPINQLHLEIDNRCFRLLALYQPIAIDLRTIMATVKINSDLERIGDLAVNIGEAARRYIKHPPVKPLVDLPRMNAIARGMLHEALEAFVTGNTTVAMNVLAQDDELDALKNQVIRELLTYMLADAATIEPAIQLILIARHLERIGDHATNIAEDVVFIVEARDVRHQAGEGAPPSQSRSSSASI